MTAFDRFDPFDPLEQRVIAAIDEIAAPRRPEYLDDVLAQTERSTQRPRWTFPGRWLPFMDTTFSRGPSSTMPARTYLLLVAVALLVLAAAAIIISGARPKLPAPVGPAVNGSLVYPAQGDIWVRSSITTTDPATRVVTGDGLETAPYLSPDGRTLVYVETRSDGDWMMAIDVDGTSPRAILTEPILTGPNVADWSQWSWSLDSTHVLVTGDFPGGVRKLLDVAADGSGASEITYEGLIPWDAYWSPVDPDVFLLRAQERGGVELQGLYIASLSTYKLTALGLPGQSTFGARYTLSGAAWSPDGKTIAYNAAAPSGDGSFRTSFRVHVVNTDGTNDRALPSVDDPDIHEGWPVFSPDGTQLLIQRFTFASTGDSSDASSSIAVLPADGSAVARDIGVRIDNTKESGMVKAWSPDGTQVLQRVDGTGKTYVVDPVTGAATELTWAQDMPDWQRRAK
jgi:Tol biopolymer transport system component